MKTVKLTRGFVAVVDDADFELVSAYKWNAMPHRRTVYARTNIRLDNGKRRSLSMHALISGIKYIDHKDGDGLNNQRENLRPATALENSRNRRPRAGQVSQYKGVSWIPRLRRWVAQIQSNGKKITIGRFLREEDAAKAYNEKARELFGDFAYLNDISQRTERAEIDHYENLTTGERISFSKKGKKIRRTAEHNRKISLGITGRVLSEESKAKISYAARLRKRGPGGLLLPGRVLTPVT